MNKKKVLIASLMFFSVASFAAGGNIEVRKQKIADHIDKRISILQTFKSCIQGSETKEAMKTCRKTKKEAMKELRASHKKNK